MTKTIVGEQPFQSVNGNFSVSPSNEGYTLQYSADGIHYSSYETPVAANDTLIVTGLPLLPIFWRLYGNNSTVTVQL